MVIKAGDKVKIDFQNVGKMPAEQMSCKFIMLKPRVDISAFASRAVQVKDNEK